MATPRKTPENIEPRAPKRMPRPPPASMKDPKPNPLELSPLALYMSKKKISATQMARLLGKPHKTVKEWRDGESVPNLVNAYLIMVVTKGVVPWAAWLGTARCKAEFADAWSKLPEEVTKQIHMPETGGFAAPLTSNRAGTKKPRDERFANNPPMDDEE